MNRSANVGAALAAAMLLATAGCSTEGGSGSGTGGSGTSSGGVVGSGGSNGTGGTGNGTGGRIGAGGLTGTGGQITTGTGGANASGGAQGSGGSGSGVAGTTGTGGSSATGGAAGAAPGSGGVSGMGGGAGQAGRVRTVQPFDTNWLFHYGDATGASGATLADTGWRSLNVPHDWSIEGPNPPTNPFSQSAASSGRGGYAPSGIGWYRKHFTLPQSLSGQRVFIEFDGVMANSDVYINGVHLGHHPYGYVSFRYDLTANVQFGAADNVIAVKTDTTTQPAERFYAGAGIYRHVRLIATNPVHIGQYATFVTTPSPTTTAATVHVTTTVLNQGTASQTVSVLGVVTDATGASVSTRPATGQAIAAGASADFAFDVPIQNPKLWDLTSPNM
jgi:beta-galactosidase